MSDIFRNRRVVLIGLMGLVLTVAAGCNMIKAFAFMTAPQSEKIAAEYTGMPQKSTIVYVWVPTEIMWDYPKIRLDLAGHLSGYLQQNIKDGNIVDPYQVESYLESVNTSSLDPTEVGRHFDADLVIHVSVHDFSIREPEMAHFYRGRLSASVKVHDLTTSDETLRAVPLRDVVVLYPESGPVFVERATPMQVRQATYESFALETGKKFHDYEQPLD